MENEVDSARLCINETGYYPTEINGELIVKNVLDTAWTDFFKKTYFSEYDVTE
ncbi:alpha-L-rhamnosidase N-terminal domain-containing protein [Catalinimonas locisalis]|uniref:alpha-L-rhamnosidase N-terminal domain-containing protein n=1 Tax=Catalinimonas locisalis TaxID=3133978 RepID=UPI00403F99C4